MLKSSIISGDFDLPEDKLPECNLFTLFLRRQTQSQIDYKFISNQSINNDVNNDMISIYSINRGSQIPKTNNSQERKTITPQRNANKSKQTLCNKQINIPTRQQSLNNVYNKMEYRNQKQQNLSILQKSRDQNPFNEDLQNLSVNQSTDFTLRTQTSQCRTRKSSMTNTPYDNSQRSTVYRFNKNTSQNRSINTEQTTQNSLERSKSNLKNKKSSKCQTPFIVYKSNKPLTTFKEFNLVSSQRQRSSSGTRNSNSNISNLNKMISHNISVSSQIENKENRDYKQSNVISQPNVNKQQQKSYLNENKSLNKQINVSNQNIQNYNKQIVTNTRQNQYHNSLHSNNKVQQLINQNMLNINQ